MVYFIVKREPVVQAIEFAREHPQDAVGMMANNTADLFKMTGDLTFKASTATLFEPHISLPLSKVSAVSSFIAVPFRCIAWTTGYAQGEDVLFDVAEGIASLTILRGEKALGEALIKTGKTAETKHVGKLLEKFGFSKAGRFAPSTIIKDVQIGTGIAGAGGGVTVDKIFEQLKEKEEERDK